MKRLTNTAVVLLLLCGMGVLLYPVASNWLSGRNHSRAIQEYAVTVEQLEREQIDRELERALLYNRSLGERPIGDAFIPGGSASAPPGYGETLNIGGMIGYLRIPAIDVDLPVYHFTTEEVLLKGVGHMEATALPVGGEGSHSVLTAHRGLPTSRLFTDLNRLQEGDLFYLHVLDRTLAYRVDRLLVVEPGDTEALRPEPGEDYVTLVTCTPYAINSHRLLARGVRTPLSGGETGQQTLPPAAEKRLRRLPVLYGLAAAALLSAALVYRRRRRR